MPQSDILIIGSGLAALAIAYHTHMHKNVTIITKKSLKDSNSVMAQGGIAVPISSEDSWKAHYKDTMEAGCFHNSSKAVEHLIKEGLCEVKALIEAGMNFDRDERGRVLLGKEGAHGCNRILHAGGDATGKKLIEFFLKKLKEKVSFIEDETAVELIVDRGYCSGATVRDRDGNMKYRYAEATIIATGGFGSLYSQTSNCPSLTGDGLAMAYKAGAELADLEFVQFHPTMLYINGETKGLISEAVRGEGAFLVDENGRRIMEGVHPFQDLAPRDVVSRAIFQQMESGKSIFLNISTVKNFRERFPTITNLCEQHSISLEKGLLPVAPGMHFAMGGISTDLNGRTSVAALYAAGEAACTGVHGANRLASNSLLEGLAFARSIANHIVKTPGQGYCRAVKKEQKLPIDTPQLPSQKEIQEMMARYVGIQRNEAGLLKAVGWFQGYTNQKNFWRFNVKEFTSEQTAVYHMLISGYLVSRSALQRTESRGAHFRTDFPFADEEAWRGKQIIQSINSLDQQGLGRAGVL
ncbi:L-aspartate oxidase [Bacillus lacus]|uniref:L-aspartate oxidase n=2 Tax=Metabacillus lacus TaxID=1983721 RepID=A0A7X2LXK8_9BACI|nr:L-aspartate oxidase [Metabacillus lacus]MRX71406.1 L-aspartate oxidase [Metabacillus lacus]